MSMYYHLITLGCQMNISDGERVESVLQNMGYEHTDSEEEADVLGIISCSVRQKPIDKVYSKIHEWNQWKQHKSLITFISGCILPRDKDELLKLFDLMFPMSELSKLPEMIRKQGVVTRAGLENPIEALPQNRHIEEFWNIEPRYRSSFDAYVPIQNGCDKFCTFCAVPYTRGREVSRPSENILQQVRELIQSNYKSITLLGQNVNSYGYDKKGRELNFAQLLQKVGEMGAESGQEFRVYFTSPHPWDMTREVIETVGRYPHLAKQIHLPLQSGDDKILLKMNRKHTLEDYRRIVKDIREIIPEATLFTDIIVGFSGETEEQFQNTMQAMDEFKYNMAYIAKYSPRPGAASYRWPDDVPEKTKKERLHRLTDVMARHTRVYNRNLIGKTLRVLVTGKNRKPGYLSGLTEGKINIRFLSDDESLIGQFVDLRITSSTDFSLEGELIPTKQKVHYESQSSV